MKITHKKIKNLNGSTFESIANQSKEYFSKVTREDEGTLSLRIKTRLLNPATDLIVSIDAKELGDETEVQFKTQVKPNMWLWGTIAVVFLIGVIIDSGAVFSNIIFSFALGGIVFWLQKNKLEKDFDLMVSDLVFKNS